MENQLSDQPGHSRMNGNMGNQLSKRPRLRRRIILPRSANWVDYKLPLEIYYMIAGFLSTRDLSALSRTSGYHRNCTEPMLYKKIGWNPLEVKIFEPHYHWAPIHLLLRTLLSRPELASYIQAFTINCRRPRKRELHNIVWPCSEPEYTTDDMMRATALINSLNLNREEKWVVVLERGEVDLFLGLLFSTFTNLRHFYLSIDYQQACEAYFREILGRLAAKNSLCSLETVDYRRRGTFCEHEGDYREKLHMQSAIDMRQVDLLFLIPSLKRITMSLTDRLFKPRFSLVDLSSLDLQQSTISPAGLGRILLATPCLKSLKSDAWINISIPVPDTRNKWEHLDCNELGRELAHVKDTLEQLYISVRFFSLLEGFDRWSLFHNDMRTKFRGIGGKVQTLRDFTKLTNLTMPTALIADWSIIRESYRFRNGEFLPPIIANLLPINTLEHLLLDDDELYKVVKLGINSEIRDSGPPLSTLFGPIGRPPWENS